jgi:hypothetical protein
MYRNQAISGSPSYTLANLLRGRLAEQILTIFLEHHGYRVSRVGIEKLVPEVKYLGRDQYISLGLPNQLRTIPDLLIVDPGIEWAKLLEIKFRRSFDRKTANELFAKLTDQREFWPESYAVILRGQAPDPARFHQDCIRVIPPDQTWLLQGPLGIDIPVDECQAMDLLWKQLPMLNTVFRFRDFEPYGDERDARGRRFLDDADSITELIRELYTPGAICRTGADNGPLGSFGDCPGESLLAGLTYGSDKPTLLTP